jgi:hypothetical protein
MNALPLISAIVVVVVIFFWLVASFTIRAWNTSGKFSSHDRWALITSFFTAVSAFALATLLINWLLIPGALWLVALTLLAVGVVGAVMRWPTLPWFAEGANTRMHYFNVAVDLLISLLLIVVAFV